MTTLPSAGISGKLPACMLQVNNGRFCQENYESAGRDAGRRARQLRTLGYHVVVSRPSAQVTPYGQVCVSTVTIRPGCCADTCDLPEVKHLRLTLGRKGGAE